MKRALITGITGQDGSYLAELLLDKGYAVHGLVRRTSAESTQRLAGLRERLVLHSGDVTDPDSLLAAVEAARPDEVYHLAAQSDVGLSFRQPAATLQITGLGAVHMLQAVRRGAPAARYYQASSSEIFGEADTPTQDESTPLRPRSPYATAKATAHFATINAREAGDLHASCGILFNHESPRRGANFVTRKITLAAARIHLGLQRVVRLGNLEARRDWGYAPDYVEAMWRMLQQDTPGDYVIATGAHRSVAEFAEHAFAAVGRDWREHVEVDPAFFRPNEVRALCGDASRAARELGWRPRTDFGDWVKAMVRADLEQVARAHGRPVPPLLEVAAR